jgi:magnesium transporter
MSDEREKHNYGLPFENEARRAIGAVRDVAAGVIGAATPFRRRRGRKRAEPGAIPGTLTADPDAMPTRLRAFGYGPDGVEELAEVESLDRVDALRRRWPVVWLDINGLGNVGLIDRIGGMFGLHRLALEDVVNLGQRTKLDDYEDQLFVVGHTIHLDARMASEQISMFIGAGFLITFQETPVDSYDPVRERIRHARGRVRSNGSDYLAYALLDATIDSYFPVLERFEIQLEAVEERLFAGRDENQLSEIHHVRRDLRLLRRLLWPLQGVMEKMLVEKSSLIKKGTHLYLRDAHDHAVRIVDHIDTLRDLGSGLMDYHLSILNNKMNEVMKVLTVIASIFIPLTFLAGIYGMNFNPETSWWNMPELNMPYGYPAVLLAMLAIGGGMYWWFRRSRWL